MIDPSCLEKLKNMHRVAVDRETVIALEAALSEIELSSACQKSLEVLYPKLVDAGKVAIDALRCAKVQTILIQRQWRLQPFGKEWCVLTCDGDIPIDTVSMEPWLFSSPFEAVLKTNEWLQYHPRHGRTVVGNATELVV